jgi:hypothetical protein
MVEDWERRHNESWVARWIRLNGKAPMTKVKATKHLNCSALMWQNNIHSDALTRASQQFKRKR